MYMLGLFTAAAFIASANAAKLTNTPQDFINVKAGQPFTITWTEASGPVTILLKNGPSTNLKTVATLAYTTLPEDQYAIEIIDSGAPNYSVQFPISGGSSAPSSSVASPTTAAPSYSSSAPAEVYPSSSYASSGYSSGIGNTTSSVYYTGTSASSRPTSSANCTSSATYSSSLTTVHCMYSHAQERSLLISTSFNIQTIPYNSP